MSAITDFATAVGSQLTSINASVAALQANGTPLPASDVAALQSVQASIASTASVLATLVATIPAPV
jgi:hypothetical protein